MSDISIAFLIVGAVLAGLLLFMGLNAEHKEEQSKK